MASPEGLAGAPGTNGNAEALLLIITIAACFTGALNAVREIVKERPIYSRERAAGLSSGAYLLSKLVVLGLISALQAVVMVVVGLSGRPMPAHGVFIKASPLVELMLAMSFLAIASMALGLLISVSVSTSEKSLPLLFVSVMAQVICTGGVFALNGKLVLEQLAWLSPSRWGFAAAAATVNLTKIAPPTPGTKPDPLWAHTPSQWLIDMALMVVLGLLFSFISWRRLVRLSPGRARR